MGYYISSAFSVSPNDRHSYFVYFVPGLEPYERLSTDWINSWVHDHFAKIAQALGPNGVIVSPPPGANWDDDTDFRRHLPFSTASNGEDAFLHGGMPFLLLSRSPLQPDNMGSSEGLALNLVKCANEHELALLFDTVVTGIRNDDWQYIIDKFPPQEPAKQPDNFGGWLDTLSKVIELKPNVFGIGVNLNAVLASFGRINARAIKSRQEE